MACIVSYPSTTVPAASTRSIFTGEKYELLTPKKRIITDKKTHTIRFITFILLRSFTFFYNFVILSYIGGNLYGNHNTGNHFYNSQY